MCDAVQILRAARQGPVDSAHRAVDIDDRVSHCLLLGGSQAGIRAASITGRKALERKRLGTITRHTDSSTKPLQR
jgi:hypothetical protein